MRTTQRKAEVKHEGCNYKFIPYPQTNYHQSSIPPSPHRLSLSVAMDDIVIREVFISLRYSISFGPKLILGDPHALRRSTPKWSPSRDPFPNSSGFSQWGVVQRPSSSPPATFGLLPRHLSATRPRPLLRISEPSNTSWLQTLVTTSS